MPPPLEIEPAEPDPGVAERMQRYGRTRDPRALWPSVNGQALGAARAAIERVVRAVLAGQQHVSIDAHGDSEAYVLGIAAFTTGTGALLARWIEDGRVTASPPVAALLVGHLEHGRRRAARIEQGVLPAFDALLARGITPVVMKGFHTAHAYCEEPGVRPMADVDIVVPPAAITDAEAALQAAGFRPTSRALRPYKREWMAAGVDPRVFSVERTDARSRWQLELHASFDRPFTQQIRARLDSERGHVAPIVVAGRPLLAPAQPLLFLVLACQLSSELNSLRLMRLIDLVRVVRTDRAGGVLHWDQLLAAFERTGAARFTYPAMALAEDLAPGTIEPRVLAAARDASTWGVRHTVRRLVPGGGSLEATSLIERFMWAHSPLAVAHSAVDKLARSLSPYGQGPAQWRAVLRHLSSGALSFFAPDEREQTTAPGHPEPRPQPADEPVTPR